MKEFVKRYQFTADKTVGLKHEPGRDVVFLDWTNVGKRTVIALSIPAIITTHKIIGELIKDRQREARKLMRKAKK